MTVEPIHFIHQGRNLEVRAVLESGKWRWAVRIFEGNNRATPHVYTVGFETAIDGEMLGVNLVGQLMHTARSDVEQGVVELLEP